MGAHCDWDEPIREAAKAAKLAAEPHTGVCGYTLVAQLAGTSVQMLNDY